MKRAEILELAERAVFGDADYLTLTTLDDEIRKASLRTGRDIQTTADLLRREAFAGDHYRGDLFDIRYGV